MIVEIRSLCGMTPLNGLKIQLLRIIRDIEIPFCKYPRWTWRAVCRGLEISGSEERRDHTHRQTGTSGPPRSLHLQVGRKEQRVLINNALNTWRQTILIARVETCCHHMGYSFQLAARVLLYTSSHSRGALAGMRNSSMGPPWTINSTTHCTMNERSYEYYISNTEVRSTEPQEQS